ncbi:AP-1-like transcription factor [Hypsizygus marmoreus]|uniref:AP-1-like transcription factor n=1 Tax=Hypsizygus marmoreus TaxID=39966 RepID=A0A369KC06_HYPMA|nr:AP-1-like transcription factor [Hypsizygus marmoreus]
MESYIDGTPLWDLSHASSFSQLADDDFLALLHKQFPTGNAAVDGGFVNGVNPQNISRYSLPSITPPSEDSSPSPPNTNNDGGGNEDSGDPALKRKASDEDFDEGPSQKAQHTAGTKKSTNPRRKSTGASGPPKDESRLLKRKEQNRAAQRAFRERKEKHVKDLEDKVAALEAKNEQAVSENENLRDLLARLQSENLSLKQGSFTFSVPKTSGSDLDNTQASTSFASQSPDFASSSRATISPPLSSATSPKLTNPLEWSSLTTFDPAMLNLLDDSPQQTATDGAMQMDFGFGANNGASSSLPFTTIASNPMFMSYASSFDSASPPTNTNQDHSNPFSFDMTGLSSWQSSPQQLQEGPSLDELLAFNNHTDFSFPLPSSTSESPIAHHVNVNHIKTNALASHSPASSSSPSSSVSDPLFDTPRDSSASDSDVGQEHNDQDCPKTKAELVKKIASSGPSPFAPINLRKSNDGASGPMIMCEGTSFPKIQKSDQNIEVLSAWRSITSNPQFKDVDINDLCTAFTNKAKCDGTKVVLEPQGVNCIIQTLSKK